MKRVNDWKEVLFTYRSKESILKQINNEIDSGWKLLSIGDTYIAPLVLRRVARCHFVR